LQIINNLAAIKLPGFLIGF
jgi:hypothetical protein